MGYIITAWDGDETGFEPPLFLRAQVFADKGDGVEIPSRLVKGDTSRILI